MNALEKYQSLNDQKQIDKFYEASSVLMDPELRKELKAFMKPTTDAELLEGYCIFHELDKGEEFEGADI